MIYIEAQGSLTVIKNIGGNMKRFEDLKGKTLSAITGAIGDEEMIFTTADGGKARLFYEHD